MEMISATTKPHSENAVFRMVFRVSEVQNSVLVSECGFVSGNRVSFSRRPFWFQKFAIRFQNAVCISECGLYLEIAVSTVCHRTFCYVSFTQISHSMKCCMTRNQGLLVIDQPGTSVYYYRDSMGQHCPTIYARSIYSPLLPTLALANTVGYCAC